MNELLLSKGLYPEKFLRDTVNYIKSVQLKNGCIPWFPGHHAETWDHVESAMGLSIGGEFEAAELAYKWLSDEQLEDGSWWEEYFETDGDATRPGKQERRETNFVAYVAVGLWHHYLITGNIEFLRQHWLMLKNAFTFVLDQQTEHGEINWAVNPDGSSKNDALLTGNSSIHKSLECGINIAVTLNEDCGEWRSARERLGHVLRHKPQRFDRHWESKARFSMDWFYPVLSGALPQADARKRLASRWDEFVESGLGCRCVSDEPWVAIAESCELTMALLAAGEHAKAVKLYSGLHQFRHHNGGYWTGYVFPDEAIWPEELTSWTAAAILLAADALTEHTPAAKLLTEVNLLEPAIQKAVTA